MKGMDVSINEAEAWGRLKDPRSHSAAFGVRLVDNERREFAAFGDRMTAVGDDRIIKKVKKWLFGKKMQKMIRENTHFVYGSDACTWTDRFDIGGNIDVRVVVVCAGEYCNVAAYADLVPRETLSHKK